MVDLVGLRERSGLVGLRAYPGEVFGTGEAAFAGKGPEHAGGGGYDAYGGEELADNYDAGLRLLPAGGWRGGSFADEANSLPWLWHRP